MSVIDGVRHEVPGDHHRLARLIGMHAQQALRVLGGPWHRAPADPSTTAPADRELYLGRAGPSVALQVAPRERSVTVGKAIGERIDSANLRWRLHDPVFTTRLPQRPDQDAAFQRDLAFAVDAAARSKEPSLHVCRYCGAIVAPEFALGDERCLDCATTLFGAHADAGASRVDDPQLHQRRGFPDGG